MCCVCVCFRNPFQVEELRGKVLHIVHASLHAQLILADTEERFRGEVFYETDEKVIKYFLLTEFIFISSNVE